MKKSILFVILNSILFLVVIFTNITLIPVPMEKGDFSVIEDELVRLGLGDYLNQTLLEKEHPKFLLSSAESSAHLAVGLVESSRCISYLLLDDLDNYETTKKYLREIIDNTPIDSMAKTTLESTYDLFDNVSKKEDITDNSLFPPYVALTATLANVNVSSLAVTATVSNLIVLAYKIVIYIILYNLLLLAFTRKVNVKVTADDIKDKMCVDRNVVFDFLKKNNDAVVIERDGSTLVWDSISFTSSKYPKGKNYLYSCEDDKHVFVDVTKHRR